MASRHHVVIVGGGFGGLYAARSLKRAPVQVTVVDRRNFHLFQPLLYEVATAALSPGEIASPLRHVLRGQDNARVWLAEVVDIDPAGRRVILADGELPYDTLVLAAGSQHSYFGHAEWESLAPGLKTVEDALGIRRRILFGFEAAEREPDPEKRRALLTFVIVGGGPTGVELAGALAEVARFTLRGDFRDINPADATILLLEGQERVLPAYSAKLSAKAQASLERLGVTVRTRTQVTAISPESVTVTSGNATEVIPVRTVLWAAGVQASPLGRVLQQKVGADLDRWGRVLVAPDLTVPGHSEIFVIGDMARVPSQDGKPLPAVAPVAMQQGRYVAEAIRKRLVESPHLRAENPAPAFRYADKGSMATIGRALAVAQVGPLRLSGYLAWLAWLFIHLLYIVEFESRVLIAIQWAWRYFTGSRGARLVTGNGTAYTTPRDTSPTISSDE
jgi:NADH dehydrogenase